jgi:L-ascorbate metabolism protein UlaG (beta-lactamase superfamily)
VRRKRQRLIAIAVAVVLAVGVASLVYLWRDRPSLEAIDWPAGPEPGSGALSATWLGVTTVLIDDGETQILIDGFFSRPSLLDGLLHRPVVNDAAIINFALYEFGIDRLAAIIPVHSHFDHAMDVGAIAKRTNASVVGSESTANIARGAGIPEDQLVVLARGGTLEFGQFKVHLLESRHGPVGWRGSVPLPGTIDEPLEFPAPLQAMRVGKAWTIVIEHPLGTTVVQGSAGFVEGALADVDADLVLLCSYGLSTLGKDYAERYWQEIVTATGAKAVMPMHFDDFTQPFGVVVPFPRVLDNIEITAGWFESFRKTWDVEVDLYKPVFGRPVAVRQPPPPST